MMSEKAVGGTPPPTVPKPASVIQIADLFDEKQLMERLDHICELKNILFTHLYHKEPLDPKALFDWLMVQRKAIAPYIGDTVSFIHKALKEGKTILLEGQGILKYMVGHEKLRPPVHHEPGGGNAAVGKALQLLHQLFRYGVAGKGKIIPDMIANPGTGGNDMVKAIVGANWGDEGKGKITDLLARGQCPTWWSRRRCLPAALPRRYPEVHGRACQP